VSIDTTSSASVNQHKHTLHQIPNDSTGCEQHMYSMQFHDQDERIVLCVQKRISAQCEEFVQYHVIHPQNWLECRNRLRCRPHYWTPGHSELLWHLLINLLSHVNLNVLLDHFNLYYTCILPLSGLLSTQVDSEGQKASILKITIYLM